MNEDEILIPLAEKKAEAVARMRAMNIYDKPAREPTVSIVG